MSAVLAVALGLTPVNESGSPQVVSVSDQTAKLVGRYSQTVDGRGRTHLRGVDRLGRPYEVIVDRGGHVEASVGDRVVSFRVTDAS